MSDFLKTNIPGLLKNKKTGAVINKNEEQRNQMLVARQRGKELIQLKRDVETLKEQVGILMDRVNGIHTSRS